MVTYGQRSDSQSQVDEHITDPLGVSAKKCLLLGRDKSNNLNDLYLNSEGIPVFLDFEHHEVHEGDHFMYTDAVQLDSGAVQNYLITTPNTTKWSHMVFILDGSAITQFELYEGTDKSGTTSQQLGNSNRNSATAATLVLHKGISGGTTDGTLIHTYKGGSATNQSKGSTGTRGQEEIILKQNTKYILRVTSGTASNLTNVQLSWYEHTF